VVKTEVMGILRQPSPVSGITDQKQLENVGHFNYLGSIITNNARCTCEIKSMTVIAKAEFNKKTLFISKLDLNLRKKIAELKQGFVWCRKLNTLESRLQILGRKKIAELKQGFVWCRKLNTLESRLQILGKF